MRSVAALIFDGQSFVHAPAGGRTIPLLVADRLDSSYGMHVVGLPGTTYATRTTDRASRSFSRFTNSAAPVLIDISGQSDLLAGLTAAQVLAAMEEYHDAARAAGASRTIACTVPSMTAAWGYTGPMETQRQALNPLILASGAWDAVADLAAVPEAADPADVTYFSDGLHPTAALAALFADEVVPLIL